MHRAHRKEMMKILIHLDPESWHGCATEMLWATQMSENRFRIENTPFYAFDVSFHDIVATKEEHGLTVFEDVVLRGGHSTYRIIRTTEDDTKFDRFWRPLKELGCTYEEGPVLAVDVPPDTDIYAAYAALEEGEAANIWGFEEGHCGHPLDK